MASVASTLITFAADDEIITAITNAANNTNPATYTKFDYNCFFGSLASRDPAAAIAIANTNSIKLIGAACPTRAAYINAVTLTVGTLHSLLLSGANNGTTVLAVRGDPDDTGFNVAFTAFAVA